MNNNISENKDGVNEVENKALNNVVESFAKGLAELAISISSGIVLEYTIKQAAEKQEKKEACAALIRKAIASNKRISKAKLFEILPCLRYCSNRQGIARYLGISIDQYDAGVKRWYHWF